MKHIVFLVTLILISSNFYSQDLIAMFKEKAYWGFMDINGEVLVEPKYTYCRPFRSGFAKVNKMHVFINKKGEKLKLPYRLLGSSQFSDGMLAIKTSKGWGFIDTSTKVIIEPQYKEVTDFDGGYAIALNKKEAFVIDKMGNSVPIDSKLPVKGVKPFSEGLAPVALGKLFGFVNPQGTVVIPPSYLTVGYFKHGVAWARDINGKIGFIDKSGNWVLKPVYLATNDFDVESGVTRVKTEKGWGYMDIEGNMLPIEGKNIDVFKKFEGGAALVRSNDLWGFLAPDGSWLLEPKYSGATPFQNGYARIKKNGKWGVIDKGGNWVLEPIYDNIKPFFIVD